MSITALVDHPAAQVRLLSWLSEPPDLFPAFVHTVDIFWIMLILSCVADLTQACQHVQQVFYALQQMMPTMRSRDSILATSTSATGSFH